MAEGLKALVLKINVSKGTVSSNLTPPGTIYFSYIILKFLYDVIYVFI